MTKYLLSLILTVSIFLGTTISTAEEQAAAVPDPSSLSATIDSLALDLTKLDQIINSTVRQLLHPVVVLASSGGSGSGVVIHETKDSLYIVTNFHILDPIVNDETYWLAIRVGHLDYNTIAEIVALDAENDLALVKAKIDTKVLGISTKFCTEPLKRFQKVFSVGSGLGNPVYPTEGIVSNPNLIKPSNWQGQYAISGKSYKYIQHTASIIYGNSGGGLFAKQGDKYCLAGINNRAGTVGGHLVPHVAFAIPAETVKQFLSWYKPIMEK